MRRVAHGPEQPAASALQILARMGILLLPVTLLGIAALRSSGEQRLLLTLGAVFQGLACALALLTRGGLRQPITPAVVMLYVIALSWIVMGRMDVHDWFFHVAQSLLLVVPLTYFAVQCLRESGAWDMRRARQLASGLSARRDWPAELQACKALPEVKALRESLRVDASPALALLSHPRPQVRVAGLAALEFRPSWRRGQPEAVLQAARQAAEPEVRAAAVNALGNTDDRVVVEALGEFLADPSLLVRQTAAVALLWNSDKNWAWLRLAVRNALAHPVCRDDGSLPLQGSPLGADAVADLTAWATEKGILAARAAATLAEHYAITLAVEHDAKLLASLRRQLVDARAPALLRLELARLLFQHRELDRPALQQMLDPASPAPLRLIAVEALLSEGASAEATAALRDLARLPNREIALATAEVVQRRLGVDLGMPRQLPPLHSRHAADVARRVLGWATRIEASDDDDTPAASHEIGWRN